MKVKVQFELDLENPIDRTLYNYAKVKSPKKIGQAIHELLRQVVIDKCIEDNRWRTLYCEPIEVKIRGGVDGGE